MKITFSLIKCHLGIFSLLSYYVPFLTEQDAKPDKKEKKKVNFQRRLERRITVGWSAIFYREGLQRKFKLWNKEPGRFFKNHVKVTQ